MVAVFEKKHLKSLFWAACVVYFTGLVFFDLRFAKLGIPLDSLFGRIVTPTSIPLKFYVTEFFLLGVAVLAALSFTKQRCQQLLSSKTFLIYILLFSYGVLRILVEFGTDPILVMRNSAFCWYLAFPLLLSFLPLRASDFERFSFLMSIYLLSSLILHPPIAWLSGGFGAGWIPCMGIMPLLWIAYSSRSFWLRSAILILLALALGLDLATSMQRTTWLGIPIFLFSVAALRLLPVKRLLNTTLALACLTGTAFGLQVGIFKTMGYLDELKYQNELAAQARLNDAEALRWERSPGFRHWVLGSAARVPDVFPWEKAESRGGGVEKFRWNMWVDALSIIKEHPLLGIGFIEQVVQRIYTGDDSYLLNNGNFEYRGAPPVSGPHNSYLNAAARLGIWVGIAFFLLHASAFWLLLRHKLFFSAWLLAGGIVYAAFNVGLEGPTRSFLLLLMLGAATCAETEQPEKSALRSVGVKYYGAAQLLWAKVLGFRKFSL